jgi:hypothetical protein
MNFVTIDKSSWGSYAIKFVVTFHLAEHSWEEFYEVKLPTPGPKIMYGRP